MEIKKYIPALEWLPKYNRNLFKGDLSAGLTVGVMLVPQGMAYAMIAGLPPIIGLYASTLPMVIYAFLGTSRQLAVGPVAMVSLLTAAGVGLIAETGSDAYIGLALTLALMVGGIQFIFGALRLGFLVNFLSHPVVSGFTSAAALIIGLSQLKHLLGVDLPRTHHVHEILIAAAERAGEINPYTFATGIAGIVLIALLKRWRPAFPGSLLAVALGILGVMVFGLEAKGVRIVGAIPGGLPSLSMPVFDFDAMQQLFPIAMTIALVGLMESVAVAKAMQSRHKDYKVRPNQELIALGAANIGAAFFQGYPVTGGFSRTAVNDQAGARTGLASIISALLVTITLLFLTPVFHNLPNAILASVIMVAVYGLIDVREARYLWRTNKADFLVLLTTFLATLLLGIEAGILVGVALSIGIVVYKASQPHVATLGKISNSSYYRNVERFPEVEKRDDLLIVRPDAQLFFANISYLSDYFDEAIAMQGDDLEALIICGESVNDIDSTGIHFLHDLKERLDKDAIDLYVCGISGPVRDRLNKAGLLDDSNFAHYFVSVQEAVNWHDSLNPENTERKYKKFAHQANR